MAKLIDDKMISYEKKEEMLNDIKRYMGCHDSLVSLYNTFVTNPILSRFLDLAMDGLKNTKDENIPKVHALKKAVELMAKAIADYEIDDDTRYKNEYKAFFKHVSETYEIDKLVLEDIIDSFEFFYHGVYGDCFEIFEDPTKTSQIDITLNGNKHIITVSDAMMLDLQKLHSLKCWG